MVSLQSEDYYHLFVGSAFFSCGGGVPREKSFALMMKASIQSPMTKLLSLDEFSPNDWLCTVYAIGASGQGNKDYGSFLLAVKHLEEHMKIRISGIIPGEIGSEINAIWTANQKGLAIADSDMVGGRAVPEEQMDIYGLNGISPVPVVIVNDKSDVLIVERAHDLSIMEQIYRSFAIASGGYCYIAGRPIQKNDALSFMPSGTISRSIAAGQCILDSKTEQQIVSGLQNLCDSRLLAKGEITGNQVSDDPGFLSGSIRIRGSDRFNGDDFTIYYKNENVMLLRNVEYMCSAPDLISVVDSKSIIPVANSSLREGMKVLVFGTPALPMWRTERGIALLGPKQFGFDYDYSPL
ncbi:MAG: DUF917 domain-containing protein [Candidatus Moraniibacteriota bacterium]